MDLCSCSSGRAFAECCEPILAGRVPAASPEALMRARYSAFARGHIDFIRDTIWPESRGDFEEESVRRWSSESTWTGLEIVRVEGGGPEDDQGVVEFIARYETDGEAQEHHEVAEFGRHEGAWYFVDGKRVGTGTYVRPGPKIGRNDPCPCGSGKKYKKCCA